MPRPDKAERARRQGLAADRRRQEELGRGREELLEQQRAAVEEDKWHAWCVAADEARDAAEYAERATDALDELAKLATAYEEDGAIPVDEVQEILRTAGHRDYLRERGWCGSGD